MAGTFDKILSQIKEVGAPIKYYNEEEDIIICQVNYDQIRKLGGDTSWCIVRSRETFNGYASVGAQWMVFLVDNIGSNDRLSKIGITTGLFDFYTAHDKYDGHMNKNMVVNILKERGFNFNDLLLSKQELFKLDNWNNFPVGALVQLGVTLSEIISKKHVFKANYAKNHGYKRDLDFFTPEEIEKYNLIDRSELDMTDLRKMTPEVIISKKCLERLTYKTTLSEVFNLKITKQDIIKHKLYNFVSVDTKSLKSFTKDELVSNEIIDLSSNVPMDALFSIGFTKEEILTKYKNIVEHQIGLILNFFEGLTKAQVIRRLSNVFWSDDKKN